MGAYVIKEVNSVTSDRDPLLVVNGSLASAKRCASRSQVFKYTVLKIENLRGFLLAYKKDGHWFDVESGYWVY